MNSRIIILKYEATVGHGEVQIDVVFFLSIFSVHFVKVENLHFIWCCSEDSCLLALM